MKKFKVRFIDIIEAESEEEAYDNVRDFCAEIYNSGDVTDDKMSPKLTYVCPLLINFRNRCESLPLLARGIEHGR